MLRCVNRGALTATLLACLCACGGGSDGQVASTPPPPVPVTAPPTTPSPPASEFTPVAAKIFAEPLYNSELQVLGRAWQHEYVPNSSSTIAGQNIRDAGDLRIAYDEATGNYMVTAPVAGTGIIMQTGEYGTYPFNYAPGLPGFPADPSDKSPTDYCCNTMSISAPASSGSPYRYVSFVDLFGTASAGQNLDTVTYGTFALVQPTKRGEVPTSGTARYTGQLYGHFAGDAGATWLEGTSRFEFDFASARLSGDLTASMRCMMGCLYEDVTYTLTNTQFARGSTTFSGALTTQGAPSDGSFSGIFAGPSASELAAQFQFPFFNPEHQGWVTARGAIAGKRD